MLRKKRAAPKKPTSNIKIGSGTTKQSKSGLVLSLNRLLIIAFIVVFGAIGTYLLFVSHADTGRCAKTKSAAECKALLAETAANAKNKQAKPIKGYDGSPAKPVKGYDGSPAKQAPVASAPKSTGPTCLILPGGHGKKCGSTYTCDSGYKLTGDMCTQIVTCKPLTTGHGQICSNGLISCEIGYNHAINPKQCTPIKCNSIANGNKCNGGRITCNSGYYSVNGGCSKISCQTQGHIIKCNNVSTISCVTGYTLVGSACNPVTCYPLKIGATVTGKTCTDKTTTCYQNFTLKEGACVPVTCNQTVTGGTKCNDGTLKCLPNYQPNAAKSGCQAIVTCKTPVANGLKCSNGKYACNGGAYATATGCAEIICQRMKSGHGEACKPSSKSYCDSNYYLVKSGKDQGTCAQIHCSALKTGHGQSCNNGAIHCEQGYTANKSNVCVTIKCIDIPNGNGQTCNNGKILCGSFHYLQNGKCVDTQCRTVSHGINCTNGQPGGRTTCDTGFFDDKGECELITCNTKITDGKSCNNGRIICANGYYRVGDKCKQITSKKINGGVKLSNGNINCNNGFKQTGSKCIRDNDIVVAYHGYNDGCGGNAMHYAANKKTHVSQQNYGKNSVCQCNTGKIVAYGKPISDSHNNPKCVSAQSSAGSNRGSGSGNGGGGNNGGGGSNSGSHGSNTCGSNDSFGDGCNDPADHNCGANGQYHLHGASGCGCVHGYTGGSCQNPPRQTDPTPTPSCRVSNGCHITNGHGGYVYCGENQYYSGGKCHDRPSNGNGGAHNNRPTVRYYCESDYKFKYPDSPGLPFWSNKPCGKGYVTLQTEVLHAE